ncbi:MAG: dTDP-4-dehydrorhamnose reductase [Patescibacteria group bacterium]|nr:dTDP-4-dehydrorhamnose reductase [Patescibacteria group bacterium]
MQKKILILGAKGNLGRQLVEIFQDGNEVIAWDREEIDITDKELVSKKVNDVKPDIIINAAAYNAVDKCEDDEQEFELAKKLNGDAVGYLAQAAIEVDAAIIHYSTDYIFAGDKKEGYKEDDEPRPVNKYGETKLMGEQELITRSGSRLKWYLIRTSKLFGQKGESELTKPNFFDIILKLSKKRDCIDVVDEEVSCFTYIVDLAMATRQLIKSGRGYGIYHIVNSGSCTWYDAALELFKTVGVGIKVNPVNSDKFPRPAKRPKYSVLLNTKIEPMRDWRDALREYLKSND